MCGAFEGTGIYNEKIETYMGGMIMDELRYQIDLLKAMNQKISGREKMFRLACDTSNNAFFYYDFESNELVTFGNWDKFFPFSLNEVKDIPMILDTLDDEYILPVRELLFLEKSGSTQCSQESCLKDGRTWYEFETRVNYGENGRPVDKIICIRNITKFKTQNEELRYLAYYDSLTGLYNRNYFVKLLTDFVRHAEKEKDIVSVLFINLDDFRKINDSMGMVIGDEVVQQYGQFLGSFSDRNVIVCRMNSDVYCMAIYDPRGNRSVEVIYKEIQDKIAQGFLLSNGNTVHVSVSVGVAEYPEASASVLELINCAEIVMFKAKAEGKAQLQYFNAPMLQDFLQTVAIENKLKQAVFNKNFILYFQPQYFTDRKKLRGMEALIRWKDENNKMISPTVFIPIAEKNGAIIPIGNWVIEESIRCYLEWKRKYDQDFIISINISSLQCRKDDFVPHILDLIRKYEIDASEIEIEITESILIEDFAEVKEKLITLREHGVRVSLDDFGTGFSSVSYLNELPIDTLKIDKSFVDKVMTDGSTRIIMESIVNMVNKLGYESIAEGVETEDQFAYLKKIGCDVIQGYLLGKPISVEEVDQVFINML